MGQSRELLQAADMHAKGAVADAEKIYRKLLQTTPNDPQLLHLAGVAAFQLGRATEAVELITRAVQSDPSAAEYHNNLATVLDSLGRQIGRASCRERVDIWV